MGAHVGSASSLAEYVGSRLCRVNADRRVLSTGHSRLDDLLSGGLRPGETLMVTGLPGVGTSMFALGVARAAALAQGVSTVVWTEDPADEVWARLVSAQAKIPITSLRDGRLTEEHRRRLEEQRSALDHAPLRVGPVGPPVDHIETLVANARSDGVRLLVLDTIGALDVLESETTKAVSLAARTHALPIVLVTRLPAANPRPSTLAEVCSVHPGAAHVDTVISLDRDDLHERESDRPGECEIRVLRNRWGPCSPVTLAFQGHYARFVDMIVERRGSRCTKGEDHE